MMEEASNIHITILLMMFLMVPFVWMMLHLYAYLSLAYGVDSAMKYIDVMKRHKRIS